MTTVREAEKIVLSCAKDYGTERLPFMQAQGRVLAEAMQADRDFPPYDRATMDGIAIAAKDFGKGLRSFSIRGTQAAGESPIELSAPGDCIEIMTGAAVPASTDAVIRYEDIAIKDGIATLQTEIISRGQNIHLRGRDRKQGETVVAANRIVNPAIISMAASLGLSTLTVKKLPRVVIISSGDELVEVDQTPSAYQIRRSNNYTLKAILQGHAIDADMLHIPDDPAITQREVGRCLGQYDAIILSGGVSMGKFDYIPQALEALAVAPLFYKVQQRPGKPFWFGRHAQGPLVFALPGNPVSGFMCIHRYFIPWLRTSLGLPEEIHYAALTDDFSFAPKLQYFLQVKLLGDTQGVVLAQPVAGNGSGDFANLADTDAFMELPAERDNFNK
ncbi:MAG: molybdopterin molybdotransferase MoeA, partial [Bacteroidetes bacterium]|nr:molybdopterin molybdotransferase MoeA [Bacteroidota bacterium]